MCNVAVFLLSFQHYYEKFKKKAFYRVNSIKSNKQSNYLTIPISRLIRVHNANERILKPKYFSYKLANHGGCICYKTGHCHRLMSNGFQMSFQFRSQLKHAYETLLGCHHTTCEQHSHNFEKIQSTFLHTFSVFGQRTTTIFLIQISSQQTNSSAEYIGRQLNYSKSSFSLCLSLSLLKSVAFAYAM